MAELDVKSILQTIPQDDRISLERFFQLLICDEVFGYTLFGQKPMSAADFCYPSYYFHRVAQRIVFDKGWGAWIRHKHFFPSDHFVLKREDLKENGNTSHFLLINKQSTLRTIQEHLDIFQNALGKAMTGEQILEKICDPDVDIHSFLSRQCLWGILFGFGKTNACNFDRENEIYKVLSGKITPPFFSKKDLESLCPLGKDFIKRYSPEQSSFISQSALGLIKELNDIIGGKKEFELFGSDFYLDRFSRPYFVSWENCPETIKMQQLYIKTRAILKEAYRNGSFLEVTFRQWMSPQEEA